MKKNIVFFVPDIFDARAIKRIKAFRSFNSNLWIFGFYRNRYKSYIYNDSNCKFFSLGKMHEKKYANRIIRLSKGLIIIIQNLKSLKNIDCFYCINLDMLLFGVLLNVLFRSKIYYEIGDILNIFLGNSFSNRILRLLEHFFLKFSHCIILTSPAFYYQYFKPTHKYNRSWLLLENKLLPKEIDFDRKAEFKQKNKIKIVYHGVLRCKRSIDLLIKLAIEFQEKCEVHIYGFPLWIDSVYLSNANTHINNFFWHGEFKYPDDLSKLLYDADILWAVDLSINMKNAKWLLPNRLYDGIFFCVPMLAISGSETSNFILKRKIGWCLRDGSYKNLRQFFKNLSFEDIYDIKMNFKKIEQNLACSIEQYKTIYESI